MGSNLLSVAPEAAAQEAEGSRLLAADVAALASAPRQMPRWVRPAIGCLCAAAAALAALARCGGPVLPQHWSGASLQGKQFLAMPTPGQLAHTPDCAMGQLPELWSAARGAPLRVKVLSYNLFWWSLFDHGHPWMQRVYAQTNGNAATQLISAANAQDPFDVMGFQECNDGDWLMKVTGLAAEYGVFRDRACCMAYRKASWTVLAKGVATAAEDPKYGDRPAQWMRLRNLQTGAVVFFLNHHGPIPIDQGGKCGAAAVGYNILQVIAGNARPGDAIVAVGDFNAHQGSATIQQIQRHLYRVFGGTADGGIDHIFSNMGVGAVAATANLGGGGSDHDAISAVLQRGAPPPASQAQAALPISQDVFNAGGSTSDALQSIMQQSPINWLRK